MFESAIKLFPEASALLNNAAMVAHDSGIHVVVARSLLALATVLIARRRQH